MKRKPKKNVPNLKFSKIFWKNFFGYFFVGAKLNGFPDGGAMWRSPYETFRSLHEKTGQSDTIILLQKLYQQISPLYKQVSD